MNKYLPVIMMFFVAFSFAQSEALVTDVQSFPFGTPRPLGQLFGVANPNVVPSVLGDWSTDITFYWDVTCDSSEFPVEIRFFLESSSGNRLDTVVTNTPSSIGCWSSHQVTITYNVPTDTPDNSYTITGAVYSNTGNRLTQLDATALTVDRDIIKDPNCISSTCDRVSVGDWSALSCSGTTQQEFRSVWTYACNTISDNCEVQSIATETRSTPVQCCTADACSVDEVCNSGSCQLQQTCENGEFISAVCSSDIILAWEICSNGIFVPISRDCSDPQQNGGISGGTCNAEFNHCQRADGEFFDFAGLGQSCDEERVCVGGGICAGGFDIFGIPIIGSTCQAPETAQPTTCDALDIGCHISNFVIFIQQLLLIMVLFVVGIFVLINAVPALLGGLFNRK